MQASEMTFGIEIECQVPESRMAGQAIGGYHRGIQMNELPQGWTAQSDISINHRRGHISVEIVSPILRGADGLRQVVEVVRMLQTWGVRVDRSCGFHVHVGANWRNNPIALRNLINLSARFEKALYAITGTKDRERNHHCAPIRNFFESIRDMTDYQMIDRMTHHDRYRAVNLVNVAGWGKHTVEFRVFQGTTNPVKIAGYIMVCLALAENAYMMNRRPKYTCTNKRHQTGRGLVYRMLRNFNWFSEKRMGDRKLGLLCPELLDSIKSEFTRLAEKYDAAT